MPKTTTRIGIAYLLVLFGAGVLYGVSCAPGALWQDSGLIQLRVWHNDIEGFLGLAIAHPLFYLVAIVAKHLPLGSFAHRVNLVSAFAGAVAVANLYLLVRLWAGKEFGALVAALTLALSHTFWQHASIAETYTLWTALFLGELVVLLQYGRTGRARYLYALGLLNGLAISVHMLAVIPLVCYAVFMTALLVQRRLRAREVGIVALLWVVGALPYEYLIVRQMIHSGQVLATLASAAFGDRWQADVLNTALSWTLVRENVLLIVLNFPTPNALLFVAGGVALCKMRSIPAFRYTLAALLVLFFVFAFRYTVSDRYAFFIPLYAVTSAIIGLGAHRIRERLPRRATAMLIVAFALLPPAVYAAAPRAARRMVWTSERGPTSPAATTTPISSGRGRRAMPAPSVSHAMRWRRPVPMRSSTPTRQRSRRCCWCRKSKAGVPMCTLSRASSTTGGPRRTMPSCSSNSWRPGRST
jgi:hypothetical protein